MRIKLCWVVFGVIAGLFAVGVTPLGQILRLHGDFRNLAVPLGILGALLAILAVVSRTGPVLKGFLIGTGASAAGWPISLYLHRLLIRSFPAEPLTYVLFFFVFTPAFIIAATGAVVVAIKRLVFSR